MINLDKLNNQQIITLMKYGDSEFQEYFFLVKCEPIIMNTIKSYQEERNIALTEEDVYKKASEKIRKLLKKIKQGEISITGNPYGYIQKTVTNLLNDEARKVKAGTILPMFRQDEDKAAKSRRERRIEETGIKIEQYGYGAGTIFQSNKHISDETWDSLLRSLKYISGVYKTKESLSSNPIPKIIDILSVAKVDLRYLLNQKLKGNVDDMISRYRELLQIKGKRLLKKQGLPTFEKWNKLVGKYKGMSESDIKTILRESTDPDPDNIEEFLSKKELKEFRRIEKTRQYWHHIELLDSQINRLSEYPEGMGFKEYVYYISPKGPKVLSDTGKMVTYQSMYLYKNIINFRVTPPRLMFEIWRKDKAFKKGKKLDRQLILMIFRNLKEKTKKTKLEFLFNSIHAKAFKDRESAIKFFENVRKSAYNKTKIDKFYKELVESIYQVSFIEKIDPDDLERLVEYSIQTT